MIERPTREYVEELLRLRGWPIHYPAIVGLRDDSVPLDAWEEWLCVLTESGFACTAGTTNPGAAPMEGTGNISTHPRGAARVSEGWYRDVFYPGYHGKGGSNQAHPCWRQCDGQYGTRSRPVLVERHRDGVWWPMTSAVVGPFNFHRARSTGLAGAVGDYSHGCIVARSLPDHWNMCLLLGYPEHGPTADQQATMRASLYILDITPSSVG